MEYIYIAAFIDMIALPYYISSSSHIWRVRFTLLSLKHALMIHFFQIFHNLYILNYFRLIKRTKTITILFFFSIKDSLFHYNLFITSYPFLIPKFQNLETISFQQIKRKFVWLIIDYISLLQIPKKKSVMKHLYMLL